MAESIHVSGVSRCRTGTGSAGALEDLGVSLDGMEIDLVEFTSPVYTDERGGPEGPPVDEQNFGQIAVITGQLVKMDRAVLAKLRGRISTTDGTLGVAGILWGVGVKYFRLLITSADEPWNFPTARLLGSTVHRIGTKRTVVNVRFQAIAFNSGGTLLYDRVAT